MSILSPSTLLTEDETFEALVSYNKFITRLQEVAFNMAKRRKLTYHEPDACYQKFFVIDNREIEVQFEDYYGGSSEFTQVYVPVSYLYSADYEAQDIAQLEAEKTEAIRLAELKAANDAETARVRKEQQEWVTYQRLKKKFEDVPDRL